MFCNEGTRQTSLGRAFFNSALLLGIVGNLKGISLQPLALLRVLGWTIPPPKGIPNAVVNYGLCPNASPEKAPLSAQKSL